MGVVVGSFENVHEANKNTVCKCAKSICILNLAISFKKLNLFHINCSLFDE